MKKHFAMVLGGAAFAGALVLSGCNNEIMQSRKYISAEEDDYSSVMPATDDNFQSEDSKSPPPIVCDYAPEDFPDYDVDTEPVSEVRRHKVQKGENPSVIAKKYGISAQELMVANDIKDPRKLKIGQELVIPSSGSVKIDKANSGATVLTAEGEYVVQAGDTVSGIAKKQGMKVADIMALNGLGEAAARKLRVGQKLKLPGKSGVAPKTTTTTNTTDKSQTTTVVDAAGEYTVKAGDTIGGIARALKVKSSDLMTINGLDEASARQLKIGQKLKVPGATSSPDADVVVIDDSFNSPQPDELPPLVDGDVFPVEVEADILVKDFAAKYRVTPDELRNVNNPEDIPGDNETLNTGLLIFVPVRN